MYTFLSTLSSERAPLIGLNPSGTSSASGTALNLGPLFSGASACYLATRAFDTPLSSTLHHFTLGLGHEHENHLILHPPPRPVSRGTTLSCIDCPPWLILLVSYWKRSWTYSSILRHCLPMLPASHHQITVHPSPCFWSYRRLARSGLCETITAAYLTPPKAEFETPTLALFSASTISRLLCSRLTNAI